MTMPLKRFALTATFGLCTAWAAEPDGPASTEASTPIKLPKGRCPTMPTPEVPRLPDGDFRLVARFLLKADGSIDRLRVEGRGPAALVRSITTAISGYRCLPAEADQEIASEFRVKVS